MKPQHAARLSLARGVTRASSPSASVLGSKSYSSWTGTSSLKQAHSSVPQTWEATPQTLDNVQTTTLDSGLKVTTISSELPLAAVGLHVKAGSRYETGESRGAAHFLRHLAFSRTSSRSPLTVTREMEVATAAFDVSASRENISYSGQLMPDYLEDYVWMLRDLMHPLAWEYIVRDAAPQVAAEVHEAETNPATALVEAIHREAYRDEGLGNSIFCPNYRVGAVTREAIIRYHHERYQASNVALVGYGIKHEQLVAHANKYFPADAFAEDKAPWTTLEAADRKPGAVYTAASSYTGGELRLPGPGNSRVALAFEGASLADPDVFAVRTLSSLLGGAARFTRDGPGVGLRSRLARNVLAKGDYVLASSALNASYSDSGLFGVFVEALPGHGADAARLLSAELNSLAGSFSVDDAELTRAKNQAKASFFREVESRTGLVDHLARHTLAGTAPLAPAQYAARFDAVTRDDLARVARRVFSSPLTLVSTGDIHGVPTKEELRPKLKA